MHIPLLKVAREVIPWVPPPLLALTEEVAHISDPARKQIMRGLVLTLTGRNVKPTDDYNAQTVLIRDMSTGLMPVSRDPNAYAVKEA